MWHLGIVAPCPAIPAPARSLYEHGDRIPVTSTLPLRQRDSGPGFLPYSRCLSQPTTPRPHNANQMLRPAITCFATTTEM